MNALLALLVELNIAAAVAIGFVLIIRRPATRLLGPHAAYSLWAIVPVVMLATLLPERTTETLVTEFLIGGLPASLVPAETGADAWLPTLLAGLWLAGVPAIALVLIRRQRDFLRDADIGLAGPAIVGFRHPRIVMPDNFDRRFSHHERKLILTHEQVHIDRNDARINAFVALLRCLFWFNPLIHVGARAMRVDQELSCDAEVIDRRPRVRRAYAETLLKTHLAARPLPVGCYWPAEAQHPLAERIDLIARKPVSARRRMVATGLVLALTSAAGLAAWAAQPERTIFRETPDVVLPFEPIPSGAQISSGAGATSLPVNLLFLPSAPRHLARPEVVTELCLSEAGAVDSVTLVQSSGDATLDVGTVAAIQYARFEPPQRNGQPLALCNYRFTVRYP